MGKMKRALDGATIIEQPGSSSGTPLLSFLVGDALLEPFWPEGLGIIRGFFSALDCASAISSFAAGKTSIEDAVDEYASSYAQLKSLTAKTRDQVVRDHGRKGTD